MELTRITSRQNPTVRQAAALAGDGELRRKTGTFLCEGARLCQDAALSGLEIAACFFTEEAGRKYGPYLEPVLKAAKERYQVEEHVAALLSSTRSTQGVFCVCKWPPALQSGPVDFAPRTSCLVLEHLQDPGNLGTILRTAEALGMGQIFLLGDCCDPLSPKVLRASMGAVFRVGLRAESSPGKLKKLLSSQGFRLHAAVPDSAAVKVTEIDFARGLHAVCIGNEGSGLTEETIALCDDRITIPMAGRAESLNASAAATVLLWEMVRKGGGDLHG